MNYLVRRKLANICAKTKLANICDCKVECYVSLKGALTRIDNNDIFGRKLLKAFPSTTSICYSGNDPACLWEFKNNNFE